MKMVLEGRRFRTDADIVLSIWCASTTAPFRPRVREPTLLLPFVPHRAARDSDKNSWPVATNDDPMGEVRLKMADLLHGHLADRTYGVTASPGCSKVSGQLQVRVAVSIRRALSMNAHEAVPISDHRLAVGLGWDMLPGNKAVDLDASCVCISRSGQIMPEETVYFGQLVSRSGAIRHTGDEREGDEDLGQGDDEIITIDLDRLPQAVLGVFFVATVATEGHSFADVKTARIRLVEWTSGIERVRFVPAMAGAHTAIFMARLARNGQGWKLTTIGDMDHTARDWGSLVPELRAYMGDIIPGIKVRRPQGGSTRPPPPRRPLPRSASPPASRGPSSARWLPAFWCTV